MPRKSALFANRASASARFCLLLKDSIYWNKEPPSASVSAGASMLLIKDASALGFFLPRFANDTKGDALYMMELVLSLEKLNFHKLRLLHDIACKHDDAEMADFIGGTRMLCLPALCRIFV